MLVERLGLEPRIVECKSTVIPISPNPLVALLGVEPNFYPWKRYVLTDRRQGQFERVDGIEPTSSGWKPEIITVIRYSQFEVETSVLVEYLSSTLTFFLSQGNNTLSLYEESNSVVLSTNQVHHHLCFRGKLNYSRFSYPFFALSVRCFTIS